MFENLFWWESQTHRRGSTLTLLCLRIFFWLGAPPLIHCKVSAPDPVMFENLFWWEGTAPNPCGCCAPNSVMFENFFLVVGLGPPTAIRGSAWTPFYLRIFWWGAPPRRRGSNQSPLWLRIFKWLGAPPPNPALLRPELHYV